MKPLTASPSQLLLEYNRQANGNAPQHRPPLQSVKLTAEKKKLSETLAKHFRGLSVYSVPIGFPLIMGYAIIPIWTCAERKQSVPIDYGLLKMSSKAILHQNVISSYCFFITYLCTLHNSVAYKPLTQSNIPWYN